MKIIFSVMLLHLLSLTAVAQQSVTPGAADFEKKWLRSGMTEMGYYAWKEGKWLEICSYSFEIRTDQQKLSVFTHLKFLHSAEQWTDTSVSDAGTFQPIYRSSFSNDKEYVLRFGKEVSGYYYDKKNKKREIVKVAVGSNFFDSYTYPYLLGLLPLSSGYKKDLPVFEYKPDHSDHVKLARIQSVKTNVFVSQLSGEHKVWQVSVLEEATQDQYEYYIDKADRRIWKIEDRSGNQHLLLLNKEIDFNPFTQPFNKEETLRLITGGNSVISGQAFARDNENKGVFKGMALLNINKKQFAQQGTTILLIPYTAFFKEWIKLNEASRKKGRSIPLPKEASSCIKVATVYDGKGNFEFVNLMPGDYLLYTEFGYVHTSHRTEVVGYTDTYINGMFQGSSANTEVNTYATNAAASIKKVVSITKAGETVSVKLKKTR
ncbi:MAG: hypothetical protein JNL59_08050 [Chitinophagaceae bacterium]|nr:hypothetical protein [Chitinophagaceae bacterium]